ncbi:MAG: hypothetical protein ABJP34_04480 [Erythrobacter sp.]
MNHPKPSTSGKSKVWRFLRWPLFLVLILWLGLCVNAWQYFSNAGLRGVYLSMRHAHQVVWLQPWIYKEKSLVSLEGAKEMTWLRKLSQKELENLMSRESLTWAGAINGEPAGGWRLLEANSLKNDMQFGERLRDGQNTFLINDRTVCFVSVRPTCFALYKDKESRIIMRNYARSDLKPEWLLLSEDDVQD